MWADRRRRRGIEALRDHYIICGFGRVGRRVAEEFRHEGAQYVVLDFSPEAKEAAAEAGVLFVEGNGTDDDDLREAGLERAHGLIAASDDDADNLYITLSARSVKDDLFIVARASNEDAAKKLRLAGADRIVQPYQAAGRVMANLILRPQVTAFVDVVTTASGNDLRFEEIEVTTASGQGGKSIRDLDIRKETGALVVALRKRDGTFDTTPTPEAVLDIGDVLIAAGTEEELRALETIFAPRETVAR
jgi:voltage-gated potassium channel